MYAAAIALYLPDPAACAVTLEKVFGEYEIPYYADVQKSLSRHPLARFVLTFLSMISEGFEPSDADALVGSEFFGGERKNRDTYLNFCTKLSSIPQRAVTVRIPFSAEISHIRQVRVSAPASPSAPLSLP